MPKQGIFTDGPNELVGKVWIKYAAKIYKQCAIRTQSEEAAKDLFQDVALKFCRNACDLKLDGSLEGWFSSVVRTTFYDGIRRLQMETPMSKLMEEHEEYKVFPETASVHYTDDARERGIQDAVEELLQSLTPVEKMVVEGTFIAGITLSEMSRDFGMNRCVLWRKRGDALQKMRRMKEQREPSQKKTDIPVFVLEGLLS